MTEPRAIVRTGTNTSTEEREVETSQRNHLANEAESVPHPQEVQRLEWFMILVVLLALLICEVILFVLALGGTVAVVDLWQSIISSLLRIGFYTTGYIGFFVVLTEYHSAIGAFLDNYLYFRRQHQPLCLRISAYLYALCVIVRIAFGFFYPFFRWFI